MTQWDNKENKNCLISVYTHKKKSTTFYIKAYSMKKSFLYNFIITNMERFEFGSIVKFIDKRIK